MSDVIRTAGRVWQRAPAELFVDQFAEDGPLGGLTRWVRENSPRADLHLWSDEQAAMHRARIFSGTVGLLDVAWAPQRFQITARRPLTQLASAWLDSTWYPIAVAPSRVERAIAFAELARDQVERRARFGVHALTGLGMLTQEYAPLLAGHLEDTEEVPAVREALLPPPIAGGSPFFSAAPDAVVADSDGRIELVRIYSSRAPELRFAAAQAQVDLALFSAEQRTLDGVAAARRRLGLPTIEVPLADAPTRARIILEAGASERLREQYEAVRRRLIERGRLAEGALVLSER
jgi:hypothetical protein